MPFYSFLVHLFYNLNTNLEHFGYFQNTFHFVFMSRQTDDIGKNVLKYLMEQTIVCIMTISAQSGKQKIKYNSHSNSPGIISRPMVVIRKVFFISNIL